MLTGTEAPLARDQLSLSGMGEGQEAKGTGNREKQSWAGLRKSIGSWEQCGPP